MECIFGRENLACCFRGVLDLPPMISWPATGVSTLEDISLGLNNCPAAATKVLLKLPDCEAEVDTVVLEELLK